MNGRRAAKAALQNPAYRPAGAFLYAVPDELPRLRTMPHAPTFQQAILDVRKIEDYCLDPTHPRGRHKARVFREVLGIVQADAMWLREMLLSGATTATAIQLESDGLGFRWRLDISIARQKKSAVVRTIWIVSSAEEGPRFVTCWVL